MTKTPRRIGFWMDSIINIKPRKDTSFALMLAAQELGHQIMYMPKYGLSLRHGEAFAQTYDIEVADTDSDFVKIGSNRTEQLKDLDCILIRVDPPFDKEYLYGTQILERAQRSGTLVINNPKAIRDCNEKLYATEFSHLMPETLVSAQHSAVREFHAEKKDLILKPLDGMGGSGIFRVTDDGLNLGVVLETLSPNQSRLIMAQEFRPEISEGDRRIIVLHGEPIDYVLARVPSNDETRGNLSAGGIGIAMQISVREREIANFVGSHLKKRGLLFVGLDIIGNYLTEINVTSPTCVREIDMQKGTKICRNFFERLFDE